MRYMFSSDAKYYCEVLVRLHEYSQEINFPSYFMSKLEKYKAEEMYLFASQVEGNTSPRVVVSLK